VSTAGRYFVSDEAEKAAHWDALQEFRELKRHRDLIIDAMGRLGKALGDFAYVLQHPRGCAFDAQPNEIIIGREQRAVARVEPTHLNWETASNLVADYTATMRRIAELEPRFRDLNEG